MISFAYDPMSTEVNKMSRETEGYVGCAIYLSINPSKQGRKDIRVKKTMKPTFTKILDREGRGYEVVKYQDLTLPAFPFNSKWAVKRKFLALKGIQHKEGDVFLCGYPKCGNHWMSNLISFMQHPVGADQQDSIIVPLVDLTSIHDLTRRPSPRLFASHLKFERMATEHKEKGGNIVLVVRNPKDVAVSMFYHSKHQTINNNQSWDNFLQYFMEGNVIFGSYFDYLKSWTSVIRTGICRNILIVYYEDLVKNCFHEVRRLQEHLGMTHTDDELQKIIERCSLGRLKSDVVGGHVDTVLLNKQGKSLIYRKGTIGDWKRHFTPAQNEAFDKHSAAHLRDSIFHFKYDISDLTSKL